MFSRIEAPPSRSNRRMHVIFHWDFARDLLLSDFYSYRARPSWTSPKTPSKLQIRNSTSETRNNFKWLKSTKFKTYLILDLTFWIFRVWIYLTSGLFRISIFGFLICFVGFWARWRSKMPSRGSRRPCDLERPRRDRALARSSAAWRRDSGDGSGSPTAG